MHLNINVQVGVTIVLECMKKYKHISIYLLVILILKFVFK